MSKSEQTVIDTQFIPHKYQDEFYRAWKEFNLCICHRGWGKTVMAVNALIAAAMRNYGEPRSFAYIAPQKGQARDITWGEFRKYLAPLIDVGEVRMNGQALEIDFKRTGNSIKLYGTDGGNDEQIRGNTFTGVIVDEFDGISFSSWLEIIRPTLRMHECWALIIGTIKQGGNMMEMAREYSGDDNWNIKIYPFETCWEDVPAYDENRYHSIRREYKDRPNEYAREYQCDDTAAGEDAIIPMPLIEAARGAHLERGAYERLVKVMGVDVATGGGRDNSCICKRWGLACFPLQEYDVDNMTLADIVAREIDVWQPDAVFIDKGRGEGVISRLRQLGYRVTGVEFGGSPVRGDIYINKRIEMYHGGIKGWLEDGGVLPDDRQLCRELAVPEFSYSRSEKFKMESKDKIKERLGRSPDKADSLALTFASRVAKRKWGTGRNREIKTVASTGYNPLKNLRGRRQQLWR